MITKTSSRKRTLNLTKGIVYRKKAEDDMSNARELLRKVMENSANAIFVIDLDGKFILFNKGSSEISGYDVKEIKGQHFSILFDHESFQQVNDKFNKAAIRGASISRFETEIVRKDGKKRFIALRLSPVPHDDKINNIVCTAEDITKLRCAENQLQQQAIEYEALSHISKVLIQAESEKIIYDQIPQIISNFFGLEVVSIELYDKQKDEIVFMGSAGIPLSDTIPIREPTKGTVSGDVIKGGKTIILSNIASYPNYKFKLLKKLNIRVFACLPMKIKKKTIGTLCLGSIENEYIHESMNIILQTIADTIAQAIEGKKAETKLKEYQQHLEELISKRTEQLKATQEKLIHAAKLSAVGKLSASIAHEFNNPICGIRNVLERVNERILNGANLDQTHKDLTTMAIKECNRIADLTRKLQDFHRPSSGIVTKMNIHNAIDEILLMGKKRLNERNIILNKRYARNIPRIEAVSDQIKQVILNIIQNAEEAIPKDGGEITITTERAKSNLKIHIKDNGSGIPQQYMNTIFEPFFTTKPAVKGTGLGLFISYGIIKKHGGNIDVKSLFGKGTTFTIILPIKTKY